MHCNICQRTCHARLHFNCAHCARDVLYHTRIHLAHALLEQETASARIEHSLTETQVASLKQPAIVPSPKDDRILHFTLESIDIEKIALKERVQLMHSFSRDLSADASSIKDEIQRRKASNVTRKSGLAAIRRELARREVVEMSPTIKTISRLHARWDELHVSTAESRLLLCKEAAGLYGLQKQRKRSTKSKIDTYTVGGLPIFHLRDLNNATPAGVTTVTSILAHLIHLVSHYLSLRLPAEIILPHRDYPLPTILPPASSYSGLIVPFPSATPTISSSNSPSASRALQKGQMPRPRPLFLRKQLGLIAKEDPQMYTAFVEGIALLAWNAAWLCKTQGIGIGDDSWEEVCDIGRSLWRLVAAQPNGSKPASASQDRRTKQDVAFGPAATTPRSTQQHAPVNSTTSHHLYSHDSVHSNLVSAAGSEHMRKWRLQDPIKVVDRVKQLLQNDRTGAGWEMLEGKEWETESTVHEHTAPATVVDASTVVVSSSTEPRNTIGDQGSDRLTPSGETSQDKTKGTSGWTKLKSR
ncbi:MAG: hypothetical protein Q9170_000469 [Blastenia crenularia]